MASGKAYAIVMAPSAHRRYKRFQVRLKQKVQEEAQTLARNPLRCPELRGPLKGIRSYHFQYENARYRIAYRVNDEREQIEILLVKSRESFYHTLKRIVR